MSSIYRPVVPPPLRSSRQAVDINGFFKVVGDALQHHIHTEGAPSGTAPIYEETFPKERLSTPDTPFDVILFSVADGRMATTSNDGGTIPRAPMMREVTSSPDTAGYNTVTFGWWESYLVQFEIWSRTNPTANELCVWFHRFLMRYAHHYKFFEAYGVKNFKFTARLIDVMDEREGQELYVRRYQYSLRLECLDSFTERQLTDLTLKVSTKRNVQSFQVTK